MAEEIELGEISNGDEARTLVRPLPEDKDCGADLWELCIDEHRGCGHYHSHDYGHDFPMTRDELVVLRDQINAALKS